MTEGAIETLEAGLPWVDSLARIRTLAEVTEGLSLVFVFGPGNLARQGLKQVEGAVRGERRVLWHRLDRQGAALSDALEAAGGEPATLLVHGLESVEPERRREIEIELNTGRNTLRSFDALVIFWIPESEREDLFRFCADLLHWRTLVATATADEVAGYRLTRMTTYDVFLNHATADKPAVEALARRLREDDGIEPFLDIWHLVPGTPRQEALEDALTASRTCAVFIGKELGLWQNEEMRVALDERVRDADFRVIPVLLPGASRPGGKDLPRFLRRLTWVDFRSGLDDEAYQRFTSGIRGIAPGAGTAAPATVPPYRAKLPPHDFFVPRRELDQIRDLLTGAAGRAVGITTALRGAGGFGKTALARDLCDDPEVRGLYPDGILWTTMGEHLRDAERTDRVLDLVRWWTSEEPPGFKSARDAGAYLKKVLAGQRVLVVVDDVWQALDLEPFRELEPGTVLATTRNVRTLPEGTPRVDVDAMTPGEAMTLLAHGLPSVDHGRLGALARRLGEWPLLLRLVSSQLLDLVRERGLDVPAALERVESRLSKAGLRAFDRRDATERGEALSLTMNVSLDALSPEDRRRYLDLAVFPEDTDVPIRVVERFWGLDDWQAEDLCRHLDDFSLLLDLDVARQTIRLHDAVRQYLIGEHDDLTALHRRLLARCRPLSGRWTDLANDDVYLWRHLAGHLVGSGEGAELRRLLFDLDYLEGTLRAVGINALLADYDALEEPGEARAVREALRLSAHVLARDWGELLGQVLAGQLLGRLEPGGEMGRRLLERAEHRAPLRPRRVNMSRTGGSLIRTLEGHTYGVGAVAVLDETRVVSASWDRTLRVWNLESGETILTLKGHTNWVNAVAVLDEARVVSASSDCTLRVWDLASGETIRILQGHTKGVNTVAVLGATRLVSASDDRTLRVWDVASGEMVRTLKGHTSRVLSVAVLNETRMVSAAYESALRVWDMATGKTIRTLEGHAFVVQAVAVLDETRVISASWDHTLRVWDVASGKTIRTLEGHTDLVLAVVVLDATRVISASSDRTLQVWDVTSGETICTLEGHTSTVYAVAVLDEAHVVSASSDRILRVWDVATGETVAIFALDAPLLAVAVAAEGSTVVAGDNTGGVHFMDLDLP